LKQDIRLLIRELPTVAHVPMEANDMSSFHGVHVVIGGHEPTIGKRHALIALIAVKRLLVSAF
jgi:hypothetical protein